MVRGERSWTRSLAISIAVTLLYSNSVLLYSLLLSSNTSVSETLWQVSLLSAGFGSLTVGVPVFLWLQYEIRSPGALLVGVLAFWHVLVYTPLLGSGRGDSPGFLFVFVWAPFYLVAYAILTAAEYWLRHQDFSIRSRPQGE